MAIQVKDQNPRNQYTATSGQTIFPYTFRIFDKSDLVVIQNAATLTEGTDYTVSGVDDVDGGNVTLTTGATTGDTITIYRDMAFERLTGYQQNGSFLGEDVNDDFDRQLLMIQQLERDSGRSINFSQDDTISSTEISNITARANKALGFDSTGEISYFSSSSPVGTLREYSNLAAAVSDVSNISIGDVVVLKERVSGKGGGTVYFDAVDATTVTEDEDSIVTGNAVVSFVLRVGGYVNVKHFGAAGDGVTDDSAPIRSAIDASANKTLYFPGGTYIVSQDGANSYCTANTVNNLTILGYGATLKCTAGSLQIFRSDGYNDLTILGLTAEGPGTDGTDLGAGLFQINNGARITLKDTRSIGSDQDGLAIATCQEVSVVNHRSDNDSKAGVYPNACTNVTVSGCHVTDGGGHTVSGNTVGIGIQSSGNTRCVIDGNVVTGITGTGIYINNTGTTHPVDNVVSNNIVANCSNPTNTNESHGIRLANGGTSKACGTVVTGNYCKANALYNYYIENHDGALIEGNTSIESDRNGFIVSTINGCVVRGNTAWNSNTSNSSSSDAFRTINSASNVTFKDNVHAALSSFATSYGPHRVQDATGGNAVNPIQMNSPTELTISSGAVTATNSYHKIDTEADAATDDLDTITYTGGNDLLVIQAISSSRTVVVKDGTGNLRLAGGDFSMDTDQDALTLVWDGSKWIEISRANNL